MLVYAVSAGVSGQRSKGTKTQTRQAIVATAEHTTVTLNDVKSLLHTLLAVSRNCQLL